MKKLNEKKWQRFSMNNVFNIGHGFYNKKPPMSPNGTVPFVGASGINNGITGFCTMQAVRDNSKVGYGPNEPIKRKLFDRGSICVVNNGSAIGYSYYQPKQFTCTHDVNPLALRNHEVSKDEALFLSQMIREQGVCFIYGRKWRPSRMVRSQFLLPIDDDDNPDYAYMAQYASEMRRSMLMRYKNYVAGQLSQLEYKDIPTLGEKEWKPFPIVDLFSSILPGKGKGLNHLKKVCADGVNYIGATNRNNGVLCYVEENTYSRPMILEGNCIGFIKNGDGSAGFAIYKAERFISTSDVLYGYADWLNKFTGPFFVVAQDMIKHKYSHGHKRNKEHLAGDKVMLPIDDDGNPDYAYMEQYAKNMMLRKYEQYLAFIDRQSADEEMDS